MPQFVFQFGIEPYFVFNFSLKFGSESCACGHEKGSDANIENVPPLTPAVRAEDVVTELAGKDFDPV